MIKFDDTLEELITVAILSRSLTERVHSSGQAIVECLRNKCKLITCGNGGSAADALHLSEELIGKYRSDRVALPAICLNSDVTAITCIANDYSYARIFDRQLSALAKSGDILVGFSTSGNSENVLSAFALAREMGVKTILLGGKDGGRAKGNCDFEIIIPSENTARIQELHTTVLHQWLEIIESENWV